MRHGARLRTGATGVVLLLCVFGLLAAGSAQAADVTPGKQVDRARAAAEPDVTVLDLKVQPTVTWWTLTRRGLLIRVRSDLQVTVKAKIGIVSKGKGFRQIASTSIDQAASVQRFRLRPAVKAAGPRRTFCLRYWVGVTATDGSGGSGSGCVKVLAGRTPKR
jgi:hypothetical protein